MRDEGRNDRERAVASVAAHQWLLLRKPLLPAEPCSLQCPPGLHHSSFQLRVAPGPSTTKDRDSDDDATVVCNCMQKWRCWILR